MKIVYWSDYACPYCYIAEARLRSAIDELGIGEEIELEPRAFELDPAAPKTCESDTLTRFARKYRLPLAEAKAQIEHISALGREAGLDFRYANSRYTNTFDAHRLMKLALSIDKKLAGKVNEALFAAYFVKNLELADREVLLGVARETGIDENLAREVLDSDRFADEVRADERGAAERGVRGVPYFLFPNGVVIPGAISKSDFVDLLRRETGAERFAAAQRGPDGCSLDCGERLRRILR